jgi:hypothetical protein
LDSPVAEDVVDGEFETRKASVSDTTSAGMHIGPFFPFTWFTESLLPGPVTIRNTFIDINGQQFL